MADFYYAFLLSRFPSSRTLVSGYFWVQGCPVLGENRRRENSRLPDDKYIIYHTFHWPYENG